MTEPKHIPLPKRWSDAALERLVRWLQTPDEALVEFKDDPTEGEGGGTDERACRVRLPGMWRDS